MYEVDYSDKHGFEWHAVSMSSRMLVIQVDFLHPEYISIEKPD